MNRGEMLKILSKNATDNATVEELKEMYYEYIWYKFEDLTQPDLIKAFEELKL